MIDMTTAGSTSASRYLRQMHNMLYGAEPAGSFAEVRYARRHRGGMGQMFFDVRDVEQWARAIERLSATDVYVGVGPRTERRGGRESVKRLHCLWADVDGPDALAAVREFRPLPAIFIYSGSPHSGHAYWPLVDPIGPDEAERENRRLARATGADMKSTDAARILRAPGTFNFKHSPPAPVTVARFEADVFIVADVVGDLPDPPAAKAAPAPGGPRPPRPVGGEGAILAIPPREYVEVLAGHRVGADGKVSCPLPDHEDRTPSCQVYDDPERGWYCFGCCRGGTIYDFAAALWGLDTRGEDFRLLRRRISERLLNTPVAA